MHLEGDPNFPSDLHITPLTISISESDVRFNSTAQAGAIKTYGIAGRIWEASHAMLAYLDPSPSIEFDPPPFTFTRFLSHSSQGRAITAIELGSGNGFAAARIASCLRPDLDLLIATDLPDVCPLLEANLLACGANDGVVRVCPLAWGSREHVDAILWELSSPLASPGDSHSCPQPKVTRDPTHVLCSDLIYFPELLAPLLRSLLHLTSPPPTLDSRTVNTWTTPLVVMSYKVRSLTKEMPFWNAFGLWFEFTPVLARQSDIHGSNSDGATLNVWRRFAPGDALDDTSVLVATRRPESLSWLIPLDDPALLNGVGANGTGSFKSDDQFEQLLLMAIDI